MQEAFLVTACIQRMEEGNIFSLSVSSHLNGGGVPHPAEGCTPISGPGREGIPPSQLQARGIPIQGLDEGTQVKMGVASSQVWMGGTPPIQVRCKVRTGDTQGSPHSEQNWMGVPPCQDWMGDPHSETEQYSEHLLRSGRYASCVHVGRLSCQILILEDFNLL